MRKAIIIIVFLFLVGCTASLIYVKNSEGVDINKDLKTDVELRKKDSIGISLIKNKTKDK